MVTVALTSCSGIIVKIEINIIRNQRFFRISFLRKFLISGEYDAA
jgi:hypothetical protein